MLATDKGGSMEAGVGQRGLVKIYISLLEVGAQRPRRDRRKPEQRKTSVMGCEGE